MSHSLITLSKFGWDFKNLSKLQEIASMLQFSYMELYLEISNMPDAAASYIHFNIFFWSSFNLYLNT